MSLSSGEYKLANVQYPEEKTNVKFVIFNITHSILLLLICDFSQSQMTSETLKSLIMNKLSRVMNNLTRSALSKCQKKETIIETIQNVFFVKKTNIIHKVAISFPGSSCEPGNETIVIFRRTNITMYMRVCTSLQHLLLAAVLELQQARLGEGCFMWRL